MTVDRRVRLAISFLAARYTCNNTERKHKHTGKELEFQIQYTLSSKVVRHPSLVSSTDIIIDNTRVGIAAMIDEQIVKFMLMEESPSF